IGENRVGGRYRVGAPTSISSDAGTVDPAPTTTEETMVPLSPQLLIAGAATLVGAGTESETSRGRLVDMILRRVGQHGPAPWSTAFVHHVGYWSHYELQGQYSSWPLPATNDPHELATFADARGILTDQPERGDVFLLWTGVRKQLARA